MTSQTNPVTWFEIYVEYLARAKAFYEAVFGCSLASEKTYGSFEAYRFPGGMPGNGAMGTHSLQVDYALFERPKPQTSRNGTLNQSVVEQSCNTTVE